MPAPDPEELAAFIDDPMAAKLETLARVRRRIARRNRNLLTLLGVLFVPATVAATLWFGTDGAGANFDFADAYWVPFAMGCIGLVFYALCWYRFVTDDIPFEYTSDMVVPVVHYIDPRFSYRPTAGFSQADFESTALTVEPICAMDCGTYFEASIRSLEIQFGAIQVRAQQRHGILRRRRICFQGLFYIATFDRSFEGRTIAISAGDERCLAADSTLSPVDSASKAIHVYATDLDDASQHITADILDPIAAFAQAFLGDRECRESPCLYVELRDHRLIIAHGHPDYFSRSDSSRRSDTAHLHQVGQQLSAALALTETLES